MIVSAVIDPESLDRVLFENDPLYGAGAQSFFETLEDAGVLLVDPDKRVLARLVDRVSSLPPKHGITIQGVLMDVLYKGKRLVKCSSGSGARSFSDAIHALAKSNGPDGFVTHPDRIEQTREVVLEPQAITLDAYPTSELHATHRQLGSLPSSIHRWSQAQAQDAFARALRYAPYLRFFDKQIGKGGRMGGFERGIAYLLDVWHKCSAHADGGTVEIYTLAKHYVPPGSDTTHRVSELRQIGAAIDKVQTDLIQPLEKRFGNSIQLHVKQAPPGDVHARHLRAGPILIQFDRGFDFIKANGDFKPSNPVKLDLRAFDDVIEFRRLPDTERA